MVGIFVVILVLLGFAPLFFSHAEDSDQLKKRYIEMYKQFDAMPEDQRNSVISNMSETDIRILMLGEAQINNEVNETIEAMAPPNMDMASIYELRSGNFTGSENVSKVSGISRILSVNENELLRFERFNITNVPELHVYFANKGDLLDSKDLGELKGIVGTQLLPR